MTKVLAVVCWRMIIERGQWRFDIEVEKSWEFQEVTSLLTQIRIGSGWKIYEFPLQFLACFIENLITEIKGPERIVPS